MIDLLLERRSIRKYKDVKVEKQKVDKIIKAGLLSPSSRNNRPWEFIVITSESIITELSKAKLHGSQFLKNAPLAIVVIADERESDVWVEDTSIASILIQLEAECMGLGSCWVQIRNRMHNKEVTSEEYVKDLLKIPDDYKVESIIGIGYPDEVKEKNTIEDFEKIHINKYGMK